jgi:hypothetical protein
MSKNMTFSRVFFFSSWSSYSILETITPAADVQKTITAVVDDQKTITAAAGVATSNPMVDRERRFDG